MPRKAAVKKTSPKKKDTKVTKKTKKSDLEELEKLAEQEQDWNNSSDESGDESVDDSCDESVDDSGADDDSGDESEVSVGADSVDDESEGSNHDESETEPEPSKKTKTTRGKAKVTKTKSVEKKTQPDEEKSKQTRNQFVRRESASLRSRVSVSKTVSRGGGASYSKKAVQSVSKFSYSDYRNSDTTLGDADIIDLLRAAIAKSHDAGQTQLKDVLFQTLKATNLECEFPLTSDTRRRRFNARKSRFSRKVGSGMMDN